jgi:hypothetical protein
MKTLMNIEYFEENIEGNEITIQTTKENCLILEGIDKIESVEKISDGFKIKFYDSLADFPKYIRIAFMD